MGGEYLSKEDYIAKLKAEGKYNPKEYFAKKADNEKDAKIKSQEEEIIRLKAEINELNIKVNRLNSSYCDLSITKSKLQETIDKSANTQLLLDILERCNFDLDRLIQTMQRSKDECDYQDGYDSCGHSEIRLEPYNMGLVKKYSKEYNNFDEALCNEMFREANNGRLCMARQRWEDKYGNILRELENFIETKNKPQNSLDEMLSMTK